MVLSDLKAISIEHESSRILMEFLKTRLDSQETIEWGLSLSEKEIIKRNALVKTLEIIETKHLKEPWFSAWQLITQSWRYSTHPENLQSDQAYIIKARFDSNQLSSDLIHKIIDYCRPRLCVQTLSRFTKPSKRPKQFRDILSASITSGEIGPLSSIDFSKIKKVEFLRELSNALDTTLNEGLVLGRKLEVKNSDSLWRLGGLSYVEFLENQNSDGDVDEFHRGIAPSVKLLNASLKRLAQLATAEVKPYMHKYSDYDNPILCRLWCSLAMSASLASTEDITRLLSKISAKMFWSAQAFPEIAVLRASRFHELSDKQQTIILNRIHKGPPSNLWLKDITKERLIAAKKYVKAKELTRILVGGNSLPHKYEVWLDQNKDDLPEKEKFNSVLFEFIKTEDSSAESDLVKKTSFEELSGVNRIEALELSLSDPQVDLGENTPRQARNWISSEENLTKLLTDLEELPLGRRNFPNFWKNFFGNLNKFNKENAEQLLTLIKTLPDSSISFAINQLTDFLMTWEALLKDQSEFLNVWKFLWPKAVLITNKLETENEGLEYDKVNPDARIASEDLETLNNPVGKLVRAFLSLCPSVDGTSNPFVENEDLGAVREMAMKASGRSGLIVRHLFIESLPYFLMADEKWTSQLLIEPLKSSKVESLALWRALGRRFHFKKVLKLIGKTITEKVLDNSLSRKTRGSFLASLVLESLNAFLDGRESVIPNPKIQQLLRQVDDEVRIDGAKVIFQFLKESSKSNNDLSAEILFNRSIKPFLNSVWPKDNSLVTRSISATFAKIPSYTGDEFSDAVDQVSPFIAPFNCWSMIDFGLYGEENGLPKLSRINSTEKASALLKLLDLSIGESESSIFPHDLSDALEKIKNVSPKLVSNAAYKRLAALSRNP